MTNSTAPDEFADVNEAVEDEWVAETTPYERIREVISHVHAPVSADSIAEDALTTPKTARKHLNTLADEGFVDTESGEHGGTYYRRSPESLVVEQAADILEHVSVEELMDRIPEMRQTISDFQDTFGAESPEELTVDQTNRVLANEVPDEEEMDPEILRKWQTTRRNLAFANAALSIANAERFVDTGSGDTEGSLAVQ